MLGVLAGRLKRRWQVTHKLEDITSARELYSRGYETSSAKNPPNHDQAYYHAINIAYFALAASERDQPAARKWAAKALEHCEKATDQKQEFWRRATQGDALFILGRLDEGFDKHAAAIALNPEPWQAVSAEDQALRVADLCGLGRQLMEKIANKYEGGDR